MTTPATILTIEDEEAIREMLGLYLESLGFTMLEAGNGEEGIAKCRSEHPDLVLCDLRMPGMDGLDVLAVMCQEFPEIPVIVVSGMGDMEDAIKALKLGAWDYITKPIEDLTVLDIAVHHALERARLLRENREYREHLVQANAKLTSTLQKLEADEAAGQHMQFQLLPKNNKSYGDYHFSRWVFTSTYLSGDFVDYFAIDADHLGFYIADVSGHGVSSGFVTVLLKSYMGRYLEDFRDNGNRDCLDPATILSRLNRDFCCRNLDKYLTMFYGVIDRANNRLSYGNSGQFPFPILFDGQQARFIRSKSLPVGLFDFAEYQTETLELPSAFTLAMISDGVLETLPESKLQTKETFLLSCLEQERHVSVTSLARQLGLDEAMELPDDVTILLIKRTI